MPKKTVLSALIGGTLLFVSSLVFAGKTWYVEGQHTNITSATNPLQLGLGVVVGRDFHENFAAEIIAGRGFYNQYLGLVLKPNVPISDRVRLHFDLSYVDVYRSDQGILFDASRAQLVYGIGTEINFTDSVYGTIGFFNTEGMNNGYQLGVGYRF